MRKLGASKQLQFGNECCYAEVLARGGQEVRAMLVGGSELRGQKYNFTLHQTPGRARRCLRSASCCPGADEMKRYIGIQSF